MPGPILPTLHATPPSAANRIEPSLARGVLPPLEHAHPPVPAGKSIGDAFAALPSDDYRIERLENGARIVVHEVPGADVVSMKIGSAAGSNQDAAGKESAAHLIEHLAFRGNGKGEPDAMSAVANMGGWTNAHTTDTETVYEVEVPVAQAERAANLLTGMYRGPSSDRYRVAQETRIVQHEMRDRLGARGTQAALELGEMLPGKLDFRSMVGTPESVEAVTPGYVRNWTEKFYSGANTVAFVEGDPRKLPLEAIRSQLGSLPEGTPAMDPDQLRVMGRFMKQMFPDTPDSELPAQVRDAMAKDPDVQPRPDNKPGSVKVVPDSSMASADLTLAFPIPDSVTPAQASLLATALNRRLMKSVREREQLSYTPYATLDGQGNLHVSASVSPDEIREATREVLQTVSGTPEALDRSTVSSARKDVLGGVLARYSTPGAAAQEAFHAELAAPGAGEVVRTSPADYLRRVSATTTSDVRAAARAILDLANVRVLATGKVSGTESIQGGFDDAGVGVDLTRIPFRKSRYEPHLQTPTGPVEQ